MSIVLLVIGLVFLIVGGDLLLKAAVSISLKLNIPKIVIGMTVVSFATSAPELIVSVQSALRGAPDLALGNVVGSNIANLGLVLGITVILSPILVTKNFYRFDWPIMMTASLLFFGFIFDGVLVFWEGAMMLLLLLFTILYLIKFQEKAVEEEPHEVGAPYSVFKTMVYLVIGSLGLAFGSQWLIDGAVSLSLQLGVSERVIGVTMVSAGTSIPELVASVMAVLRKEKAISIGNLVGSNLFNILAVLGISSMVIPIEVMDRTLLNFDIYVMLFISFLILPLVFIPNGLRLGWRDGILLLAIYIGYIYMTV